MANETQTRRTNQQANKKLNDSSTQTTTQMTTEWTSETLFDVRSPIKLQTTTDLPTSAKTQKINKIKIK